MNTNAAALADILRNLTPCRNPEQAAADLLDQFGSFSAVLEARPEALRKHVSAGTAEKLSAILPAFRAYEAAKMETPQQISNHREFESFCKSLVAGERTEKFYVICVNTQCRILGTRCISSGSLSEVAAYPRLVAETALNYNAAAVFLCHNHPGGTCAPSAEDINSTNQLQKMLKAIDVRLLDHAIIAGLNVYSMIAHGDINYR